VCKYSVIATTVDDIGDHIAGFVDSFSQDPIAEIILVRQESSCSTPSVQRYDGLVDLTVPVSSRATALNIGLLNATADWLWVTDIDVILEGNMSRALSLLDPVGVYGNDYRDLQIGELKCNYHWVDGWSILFHRSVYEAIGGFDEHFLASGYLDGDFCFRAAEAGFESHWGNFPLRHLRTSTRLQISKYDEGKVLNRSYLKAKWGLEELYG